MTPPLRARPAVKKEELPDQFSLALQPKEDPAEPYTVPIPPMVSVCMHAADLASVPPTSVARGGQWKRCGYAERPEVREVVEMNVQSNMTESPALRSLTSMILGR